MARPTSMLASPTVVLSLLLLLLSLVLPACLAQVRFLAMTATITGLYPTIGSQMGGTQLTITGSGFLRQGTAGTTTVTLGGASCTEINYYTTDTHFVCVTPSSGTFFEGTATVPVQMTLQGTGYDSTAQCAPGLGQCNFRYLYSSTPFLDTVSAEVVLPGSVVTYSGLLQGNYYSQYDVFVGPSRCVLGWNVASPANQENAGIGGDYYFDVTQTCQVANQTAGRYLFTLAIRPDPDASTLQAPTFPTAGYGAALINNQTLQVTDDGTVYSVVQAPVILGLSYSQGATSGGQLLTLTGLGFTTQCGQVAVTIGQTAAAVVNCSATAIIVQTSASQASNALESAASATGDFGSPTYSYARGSLGASYAGPGVSRLMLGGVAQTVPVVGSKTISGLLTVPYTGTYQFYVISRTAGTFALSTDNTPANQVTLVSFTQNGGSPFWQSAAQISSWVALTAGRSYYYTAACDTWDFSVAVRVHSAGQTATTPFLPTDTTEHALYQSFPTSAILTVAPAITREVQTITVTGATGGYFQLSASIYTADIPIPPTMTPSDPTTIAAIQSFVDQWSGCYGGDAPAVGSAASSGSGTVSTGFTWTISFNCPAPVVGTRPSISLANVNLTGAPIAFHWARTVTPSAPIGGTYRVGFVQGGSTSWSSPIQAFGPYPEFELRAAMANLVGSSASVAVTTYTFASLASLMPGDGYTFTVQVTYVHGDASSLFVFDSSSLTGTAAAATWQVVQAGSLDRFYSPLPSEWSSVAADQNQVSVSVNGVRSVCAAAAGGANNVATFLGSAVPAVTNCQYLYTSALVPTLTSLSSSSGSADAVLTLTGTGFDSNPANNRITFTATGSTVYAAPPPCIPSSASATQLVCTLPAISAGRYQVVVQVTSAGTLASTATPLYYTVSAVYNTPNPLVLTGSIAGGALLVLTGSGFQVPQSLSFVGNDSFVESGNYSATGGDVVLVGGLPCTLEDVSYTLLICRVPAAQPAVAATVAITINGQATSWTYAYATASTPRVTALTPSSVSSAITTIVTLTGSGFVVPSAYPAFFYAADTDNPFGYSAANAAAVFDDSLFTQVAVHFGSRACIVLTVSATQVTCQITRGAPTDPSLNDLVNSPQLYVMGLGYAQSAEITLEVALQVNSVYPLIGSLNGGQYITISGAGFQAQSTTEVTIDILTDKQLSDYPSMTTSGVRMHPMSLAQGEVALEDRFFPMQAQHGHADAHPSAKPTTAKDVLDQVMMRMHHRASSSKASTISQSRFQALATGDSFGWAGYSIPCAITSLSYTQIVCFTQPTGLTPAAFTGTGYTSIVGIVHVNINDIPSVCATSDPSQSCLYGFDTAHTPTITAVSPTTGPATTSITITGTSLDDALSSVLIGYDTCTDVTQSATFITCTVPGNTASTVPIQVLFSDVGFASNSSLLTFTHTLAIAGVSPLSGSYAGGSTVTLTGSGFGAVTTDNVVTLNGPAGDRGVHVPHLSGHHHAGVRLLLRRHVRRAVADRGRLLLRQLPLPERGRAVGVPRAGQRQRGAGVLVQHHGGLHLHQHPDALPHRRLPAVGQRGHGDHSHWRGLRDGNHR